MKKLIYAFLSLTIVFALVVLYGCEKDNGTHENGTISLYLTDAPIDAENVTGVYITITGIEYNVSSDNWEFFEEFEGPDTFNLLDLTGGETALLGNFNAGSGKYTGLRFHLDAPVSGEQPSSNPGCYLEFSDETTTPLFVPSGGQTGYKAVGEFSVPINGTVNVTADFDTRKSVVKASVSGMYILKPTIRIIVENEAGIISGNITNLPDSGDIIIYAYEDTVYTESEAADPEPENSRFPNAITSAKVQENGNYDLPFLAVGIYDLVVVLIVDGEFQEVPGIVEDVQVESGATTTQDIDLDSL